MTREFEQTSEWAADHRKTCVLVLGMHRSGTSAITRMISLFGAALPKTLMPPVAGNNDAGFWESQALANYHDQVLAVCNSSWDDWQQLNFHGPTAPARHHVRSQIASLVSAEFEGRDLIVIKEPRICRFADLFIEGLAEAGYKCRVVVAIRNPIEVAESLEKRDGMERPDALLLWLRHALDAEHYSRQLDRVVVSYESLFRDTAGVLEKISSLPEVGWPHTTSDVERRVTSFLEPGLRHHVRTPEDVIHDPLTRLWISEVHEALLFLESNPHSNAALATLDRIRQQVNQVSPFLGRIVAAKAAGYASRLYEFEASSTQRLAAQDARLMELQGNLDRANCSLAESEAEVAVLKAQLAEQFAHHQANLVRVESERDGANRNLAEKEAEVAALKAQVAEQVAHHQANLERVEGERDGANRNLAERETEVTALKAQVAEQVAQQQADLARVERERDGANRNLAEREAEVAALKAQLAEQFAHHQANLVRVEGERDGANSNLAEREAEFTALKAQYAEQVARHQADLVRVERERDSANRNVVDREAEVTALKAQIAELIAEQRSEFSRYQSDLERTSRSIVAREDEIRSLKHQLVTDQSHAAALREAFDQEVQSLSCKVSDLDGTNARLRGELDGLSAEASSSQAQWRLREQQLLTEVEATQYVVSALRSSHSWKITAPLRGLATFLIIRPAAYARKLARSRARGRGSLKSTSAERRDADADRGCEPDREKPAVETDSNPNPGALTRAIEILEPAFVPQTVERPPHRLNAKLIAFYLPQFHPIPENDSWWGEGFTEWTNVRPAQPQFPGHYQPHEPEALGYYDLRDPAVRRKQVQLARLYGLHGFCFYFYWFAGKRLLEQPVVDYVGDKSIDFPFCLCWANENWSRRWDGLDSEMLIGQNHSPLDDIDFIAYVARYLRDPRYIRVGGRPLLVVYRPELLPDPKATAQRWRDYCARNGIGEIMLATTQSFRLGNPKDLGFDVAIEFPPNNSAPPNITQQIVPPDSGFEGTVYDWRAFVERSRAFVKPPYKLFRTVCPSWDNTARRKKRGTIFWGNTPELYEEWLQNAVAATIASSVPHERLLFVNAWNEWAEGAHLEPDQRYGYAWLDATRRALVPPALTRNKIIVVTHDAHPHGAQFLALALVHELSVRMRFEVTVLSLGEGPLEPQFRSLAPYIRVESSGDRSDIAELARRLHSDGYRSAIVNTLVGSVIVDALAEAKLTCVTLVHELPGIITSYGLEENCRRAARHSASIVFASPLVQAGFEHYATPASQQAMIRPQGLYKRNALALAPLEERRHRLRWHLGLPGDSIIVLGVGYADHRKGVDLFIDAGIAAARRNSSLHFVWIGHWAADMQQYATAALDSNPDVKSRFHFPGRTDDTNVYYAGADLLALTSREDPFPSTVLEAMEVGLPVVGFAGATGTQTLLAEVAGRTVPAEDRTALADVFVDLSKQPQWLTDARSKTPELIAERFAFRSYVLDICSRCNFPMPRVSVIVPNYNYAKYISSRLSSIIEQSHPVSEIIFLDDASSDGSVDIARKILATSGISYRIVINEKNSGSVFAQWRRGVELATGDFVWIAEADDLSEPEFLEETIKPLSNQRVVLSYSESKQIDEDDAVTADDYLYYVEDIDQEKWRHAYEVDGLEEIRSALSIRNTIPNVSAVVMRRDALLEVLTQDFAEIARYKVAGDWLTYIKLASRGRVAFTPKSLNYHRRHQRSVTISSFNDGQLREIRDVQLWAADKYQLSPATRAAADAYLNRLCSQFSVDRVRIE